MRYFCELCGTSVVLCGTFAVLCGTFGVLCGTSVKSMVLVAYITVLLCTLMSFSELCNHFSMFGQPVVKNDNMLVFFMSVFVALEQKKGTVRV